jgi:hypothetical protein
MSGTALGWVKRITAPCAQSRNLARVLADYADDDLFAFPSIRTMARELQLSERMVKRYLRALEAAGLLVGFDVIDRATKRTRSSSYWFPVFATAPNERLIASHELKVGGRLTRHDLGSDLGDETGGEGVAGDTLEGGADDTGTGVADDTGRVSPMTPLNPPLEPTGPNGPTSGGREASPFDQLFAAWAAVAPGRLSRPRCVEPWAEQAEAAGGDEALARYGLRYLAEDPDVQRGWAMGLDRWLAEKRWEPWAIAERSAACAPNGVRASGVAAAVADGLPEDVAQLLAGLEWEASKFVAGARWRVADRTLETVSNVGAETLIRAIGPAALQHHNMTIEKAGVTREG